MKMVKSLILGSAAGLVVMSGAQAADLPVKAKAVEYVRICSLYGAGFFYIPGTDTCIKLGGFIRADVTFNGGNTDQPLVGADQAFHGRYANIFNDYSRFALTIDTRTATEYGVVRTFGQGDFTFSTNGSNTNFSSSVNVVAGIGNNGYSNYVGNGVAAVENAFIQFAGFTIGKSASAYVTPWQGFLGQNSAYLVGGYDTVTGINNIQYTAQLGGGVSATIGLDDVSNGYNRTQIINAVQAGPGGNPTNPQTGVLAGYGAASGYVTAQGTAYSGQLVPDIVGNIRVDQAWGVFQFSAAAHDVTPSYWAEANGFGTVFTSAVGTGQAGNQWTGHPDSKWGGAVQASLQIKNLPTGAGDDFKVDASYGDGATKYVLGTSANLPGSYYLWSGGPTGTEGKFASGTITDGIYGGVTGANPGGPGSVPLQLTQSYGVRAAYNHNWDPYWSSTLFGGGAWVHYNQTAITAYCNTVGGNALIGGGPGTGAIVPIAGTGFHCDPGFSVFEVGGTTRWTPVKNLTFSGEVMYTYLHTNSTGQFISGFSSTFPVTNTTLPTQYGSQGTFTLNFRAQRNF